jgi:aminomethyltransferase
LPVLYVGKGIIKEHLHCRTNASLFDVSHMGQLIITGPDRLKLLQRTTVGNTARKLLLIKVDKRME